MSYRLYEIESLMRDANADLEASRKRIAGLEKLVAELQHRVREDGKALKYVEKLFAREAAIRLETEYERDMALRRLAAYETPDVETCSMFWHLEDGLALARGRILWPGDPGWVGPRPRGFGGLVHGFDASSAEGDDRCA